MPLECYLLVRKQFPQYEKTQLKAWVAKFFKLWCRNQWKRERYAPSFHMDDRNLDPKTWCRFPILSGGFTYELKLLEEFLD
jgi:NAD+ synthase (glutamine-hydrolysing)